jgi:hypothetical protein
MAARDIDDEGITGQVINSEGGFRRCDDERPVGRVGRRERGSR